METSKWQRERLMNKPSLPVRLWDEDMKWKLDAVDLNMNPRGNVPHDVGRKFTKPRNNDHFMLQQYDCSPAREAVLLNNQLFAEIKNIYLSIVT